MVFHRMLGAGIGIAGNEHAFVIITDGGTTTLAHDGGVCRSAGRGPSNEIWVDCTRRIERIRGTAPFDFLPPLAAAEGLSFSSDGGVWRLTTSAGMPTIGRLIAGTWSATTGLCNSSLGETFETQFPDWSANTADTAVFVCTRGPANHQTVLKRIDGTTISTVATFDAGVPFVSARNDVVALTTLAPTVGPFTPLLMSVQGQPIEFDAGLPAPGFPIHWGSDGTLLGFDGNSGYRLVPAAGWQPLSGVGFGFDAFGADRISIFPPAFQAVTSGPFAVEAFPRYDVAVPTGATSMWETDRVEVVIGQARYELTPHAIIDRFETVSSGLRAGLADGGYAVLTSSSPTLSLERFNAGAFTTTTVDVSPGLFMSRLVLLPTGTAYALASSPDGGRLYRAEVDGGVTRVAVSMVNPDLLREAGPTSIAYGRRTPANFSELFDDGGVRALGAPGTSVSDLCWTDGRWFAIASSRFQTSTDGMSWAQGPVDPPNALTCGGGLAAGLGYRSAGGASEYDVVVYDGGAVSRVKVPAPVSAGYVFIDRTGRVWFGNHEGQIALTR